MLPVMDTTNTTMKTLKPIDFVLPNSFLSLTVWNTRAPVEQEFVFSMEHLYLLINLVLDYFFKPGIPSSILTEELIDKPHVVLEDNKFEIVDHYGIALILFSTLLLLAIFIPILLIMCCCFCCTKPAPRRSRSRQSHNPQHYSGGRQAGGSRNNRAPPHHHHRKSSSNYKVEQTCDFCIRPIISLLLLSLLVLCFLFIVCAFVTNDFVFTGVQKLPRAANHSLSDFEIYFNNTQQELNILFKTNFAQLESQLRKNLNMSGDIVKQRLAVISKAISINNLTEIVTNLQPILKDLKKLINDTNELKFLTAQLKGKINRSKQDLDEFFTICRHQICLELKEKYHHLMQSFSISSRIESLPKLSPIIEKIQYLLNRDIVSEIRKGKDKLDLLSKEIQKVVNEVLPNVQSIMRNANRALNENVDSINNVLAQPISHIHSMQHQLSRSQKFISKYDHYFHYIGVVCSVVVFAILLCYFTGLLFGVCNDQPTRYNYKNRSKKSDFCFYFGMTLFFLSFTVLLTLSTISFLAGGLSDRSVCFYLENTTDPSSEKVLLLIQQKMELELEKQEHQHREEMKQVFGYLKHHRLVDIINRCHRNESLFNVLQLSLDQKIKTYVDDKETFLNLSEIILFKERNAIEDYLHNLLNKLNVNPTSIVLLTDEGQQLINVLRDTPLETLNFSNFAHVIRHSITPLDLETLSRKLEEESLRLPETEIENVARLRNIAMDLKSSRDLIRLITNKIENLTKYAEKIERKSHYNGRGMRETLTILLKQAHDAQEFINQKGKSEIKVVLKLFIHDISSLISQYITHVEYRIKNEIGRCEPVSRAYNHTIASVCDDIVLPFTACWFSITVSLLIFLPSTLLVYILAALFRRIKRSSARRESILIIDNFEDDDIPLADIGGSGSSRSSKPASTRRVLPSAPLGPFESHSEEETWSPGAIPQHLYSRPPPYNF